MKTVFYNILLIMGMIVGTVLPGEHVPSSTNIKSKNYIISPEVDQAMDSLDPIALEAALKKYGPLCKHAYLLLTLHLTQIMRNVPYSNLLYFFEKPLPQHKTFWEVVGLPLSAGMSLTAALCLTMIGSMNSDMVSRMQKYSAVIAGGALGVYALVSFYWVIKQDQADKEARNKQMQQRQQEIKKKIEKIAQMLEVLGKHPIKNDEN